MAPSATTVQALTTKVKRPIPPGIQTNGINSSTSSPSPSMSARGLPSGGVKYPPNSAASNASNSGPRSANRTRRDTPGQLLGRGQRTTSVGLRSGSAVGEISVPQAVQPQPYIQSDAYILKKYRGNPPSLIIHLHPTHFRFDQQEGSFSYKSPMRILIEHLKLRTIPHDLVEYFAQSGVPFYEGCMIVQVHDHKSVAPTQSVNKAKSGASKAIPFSVHNYNKFLTPSSYVPYPTDNALTPKEEPVEDEKELKLSEQKDKENMPAPSLPGEGQRHKSESQTKKVSVSTVVLHPTELSKHIELALKIITPRSTTDGRLDSGGTQSAILPPTPITAVPSTPLTSMPPPAKKQKKMKMELDGSNFHAAEAQITFATTSALVLDPVNSATECARLLESLAHPMHSEKPPLPKTRKRTVAEMAADEALAAEQERYMLLLDERLSANLASSKGGTNVADADGQAGGASFEPRFERFKVIENIKVQHAEAKKAEKLRQQEAERKQAQEREREKLRLEAEKREQEKLRALQMQQQQAAARQQQEAHRRALAAQAQQQAQGMTGMPQQPQMQHGHPQQPGMMPNGMQSQPQRFHQQQVSQSQMSSPIARNGTPQGHSSPIVNNIGNVPMQPSTSSMGGSPPRPGSVVHQNHMPASAPGSHGMTSQRSQQSHSGTPRMPNATPQIQNTPLSRQMSQTPRITQASPLQTVAMPQMPQQMTPMMIGGQPINLNPAQQAQINQQILQQRLMRQNQQAAAQGMGNMMNGQQLTPAQQQFLQTQQMMQRQQNPMQANQLAQNYAAQMSAMARAQNQNMQPNMQQNFMNGSNGMPTMQQMQQMQQAAQQQPHITQAQMQQAAQHQLYQAQVVKLANTLYQQGIGQLQQQYPNGIPEDIARNLRVQCNQNATMQVQNNFRMRRMAAQQQAAQMAAQQGMQQNMNTMQNGMGMGMGMQRHQGM
ncbi:hypothetical protein B7463_g8631, partial [Scytalidium lignicola]